MSCDVRAFIAGAIELIEGFQVFHTVNDKKPYGIVAEFAD